MDIDIQPSQLAGKVSAIASKSMAHRLLILAAFSQTSCDIDCNATSADIEATVRCLNALGAHIVRTKRGFRVTPLSRASLTHSAQAPRTSQVTADPSSQNVSPDSSQLVSLDCGESGSTLRFLLPVVGALGCGARFIVHGRLSQRPLRPLSEQLMHHGCTFTQKDHGALEMTGTLQGGLFVLSGNVSSQFVTGLLLAAPLVSESLHIRVAEPVQSLPYISLTIHALAAFGVDVALSHEHVDGHPYVSYRITPPAAGLSAPRTLAVEGDWSNAAFWLAAGAIGTKPLTVTGLHLASAQGDRSILAALALFGAQVSRRGDAASVSPAPLHGITLNVSNIPDLVPPLAAVAACATGTTRLSHAERLRLKESDRLESVSATLRAFGVPVTLEGDDLVICGGGPLTGGTVDAADDHRIAMMAALLATNATEPSTIIGADCVAKSYPNFFDHFTSLGGVALEHTTS